MPSRSPSRLPYVRGVKARGSLYLYYRRDGRSLPLTGPEGSAAFLSEYDAAHAQFERDPGTWNTHTLGHAIEDYLKSADFRSLAPNTQSSYTRELGRVSAASGAVYLDHIDLAWMERLRDAYVGRGEQWNSLRSRMVAVFDRYRKLHPARMPHNPWRDVRRLPVAQSDQNRLWPDDVLLTVLRAATPEFRALLVTLLLTGQRISDVVALSPEQYDPSRATLTLAQIKTAKPMQLHVPTALAQVFAAMAGRVKNRLLVSPRGRPWNAKGAEETLRVLLRHVKLDRYTLHGLRATGPSALKSLGFENRAIRALTGHDSDQNLEVYLRGVASYPMAKIAQDALADRFEQVMGEAIVGSNSRRFSGVTGRAAAIVPSPTTSNRTSASGKQVANVKPVLAKTG